MAEGDAASARRAVSARRAERDHGPSRVRTAETHNQVVKQPGLQSYLFMSIKLESHIDTINLAKLLTFLSI